MDKTFYTKDVYVAQNASLHREDSSWKFDKIRPILDSLLANRDLRGKEIKILDIKKLRNVPFFAHLQGDGFCFSANAS